MSLPPRKPLVAGFEALADIGVYEFDLRTQDLVCSDVFFEIAGIAPLRGRIAADTSMEMFHPDDRDRLRAAGRDAIATGRADSVRR